MPELATHLTCLWLGGAIFAWMTHAGCGLGAPSWERLASAALWPTYPFWPAGRRR